MFLFEKQRDLVKRVFKQNFTTFFASLIEKNRKLGSKKRKKRKEANKNKI